MASKLLLITVFVFDLIAFGLAVAAEQRKSILASRCFCCGKPLNPGGSRACAVVLFIICGTWVFFIIAEVCLLAGSVENAYHTKYMTIFGEGES
ncbi:uncharacterized protein LOC114391754 [Glycine soja]|uniref:uncharacterized protein LOC114391754 n=1 Tax=Glycine soja TaxID=3848 RepID=UPI00103EB0E9|nr:uncharacterized protein LOC114391754 [Glycine soja]